MPSWDVTFDRRIALDDLDLIRRVAEAEAVAKFIRGVPLRPSVQARLDQLNIMRAVRGTIGIEGADLAEDEVERILAAPPDTRALPAAKAREEQEARNAEAVMRFVATTLDGEPSRPITEQLICEIHRLTTEGIDYPNNVPGTYRAHPVSAGTYIPPREGSTIRRLMGEFVDWVNGPPATNWPQIVRAIAAHFYFISIHPFGDGNGRTARAIESYMLYQAGVSVLSFYSLANFYYRRRSDYEQLLDACRFNAGGDLTPFVLFALNGLTEELDTVREEVIAEATRTAFREYARETILGADGVSVAVKSRLSAFLYEIPGEIDEAELLSGRDSRAWVWGSVSRKTLTRDLDRLERLELISRADGVIRPRFDVMEQFKR